MPGLPARHFNNQAIEMPSFLPGMHGACMMTCLPRREAVPRAVRSRHATRRKHCCPGTPSAAIPGER